MISLRPPINGQPLPPVDTILHYGQRECEQQKLAGPSWRAHGASPAPYYKEDQHRWSTVDHHDWWTAGKLPGFAAVRLSHCTQQRCQRTETYRPAVAGNAANHGCFSQVRGEQVRREEVVRLGCVHKQLFLSSHKSSWLLVVSWLL